MAEAVALVRAFDQARHIGDHKTAIAAQRDDAEVRRERGEGIIRNLRFRRRYHRDERGLAGVGKTDETHIREQLQREMQIEFFTDLARLHLARRAIGGRREVRVAQAAASAFREPHALADDGEVRYLRELARLGILRVDQRADRNGDVEILAAASGPSAPAPLPPRGALYSGLNWKWTSVLRCGSATANTEPPTPPLPPSGPPRGTNFSRRKLSEPLPPCPAVTWMSTSSTNCMGGQESGIRNQQSAFGIARVIPDSRFLIPYSTG